MAEIDVIKYDEKFHGHAPDFLFRNCQAHDHIGKYRNGVLMNHHGDKPCIHVIPLRNVMRKKKRLAVLNLAVANNKERSYFADRDLKEEKKESVREHIIPIVLDIDHGTFTGTGDDHDDGKDEKKDNSDNDKKPRLDEFLKQLRGLLNMKTAQIHGISIQKGSSIVWIKFRDIDKDELKETINEFLNNSKEMAHIDNFHSFYKINVNKTSDLSAKIFKFEHQNDDTSMSPDNSELNEWLDLQLDRLIPTIQKHLEIGHLEFRIDDIMVIDSIEQIEKFKKHQDYDKSILLFRGSKCQDFATLINGDIDEKNRITSLGSLYGIGAYYTSFPAYAAQYYCMKNRWEDQDWETQEFNFSENEYITLVGSLVNVGKRKVIDRRLKDGEQMIEKGYDSHYVKVQKYLPASKDAINNEDHFNKNSDKRMGFDKKVYDEYVIKDVTRILPRYLIRLECVRKIFVWRNTSYDEYPNAPIYEKISQKNTIYVCKNSESALSIIDLRKNYVKIYIISNSRGGQDFINGVMKRNDSNISKHDILIFTVNVGPTQKWATPQGITVTNSPRKVEQFVEKYGYS